MSGGKCSTAETIILELLNKTLREEHHFGKQHHFGHHFGHQIGTVHYLGIKLGQYKLGAWRTMKVPDWRLEGWGHL